MTFVGKILASVAVLAALPVAAQQSMVSDADAPLWQAVGRLNVAGNRSCTATLISPDEAITAAHCLFHPVTHHRAAPADIRFLPGFRRDSYAALVGVAAVAILPGYTYDGPSTQGKPAIDLALLRLDHSVDGVTSFAVVDWPANAPAFDIIGYGRDRPQIASIREDCRFEAWVGAGILLDCAVVAGLSGAPVVVAGQQSVVAVVSASVGTRVNGTQALVIPIRALAGRSAGGIGAMKRAPEGALSDP